MLHTPGHRQLDWMWCRNSITYAYQGKQNFAKIGFCQKTLGYIAGVWVVKTRLWWGLWNIQWGESESGRRCGSIGRVQKLIWSHGRSVFDVWADGFFDIFFGRREMFKISVFWNGFFIKRVPVGANRVLIDENGHSWLRLSWFWSPFWPKLLFLTISRVKQNIKLLLIC